jgi:hypothetical protein
LPPVEEDEVDVAGAELVFVEVEAEEDLEVDVDVDLAVEEAAVPGRHWLYQSLL